LSPPTYKYVDNQKKQAKNEIGYAWQSGIGSVYSQSGGQPIAQYLYTITLGKRQGQMKVVAIHMSPRR
jgi:hypothetical protein